MRCEVCRSISTDVLEYSFCNEDCFFHFIIESLLKKEITTIFELSFISNNLSTDGNISKTNSKHYFDSEKKLKVYREERENKSFEVYGMQRTFTDFIEKKIKINLKPFFSRTDNSKDYWETPLDFFMQLDHIFHFTIDACATKENTKCQKFYSEAENGLIQDWNNEIAFINPPFSTSKEWLKKCYEEAQIHHTTCVMIIPSRTDTKAWRDYAMKSDEIWFCNPRVNFLLHGKKTKNGSTFPLAVIIFRKTQRETPLIKSFEWKKEQGLKKNA